MNAAENAVQNHKLTETDKTVLNKLVDEEIAEREEKGLSVDKNKIKKRIENNLRKGYIPTSEIERIVGGDNYTATVELAGKENALKTEISTLEGIENRTNEQTTRLNQAKQELSALDIDGARTKLSNNTMKLVSDSKIAESYRETDRRSQPLEVDLKKIDKSRRDFYKRATESGLINNTNRTKEMLSFVSAVEADKGVKFDFTNTEQLKELGLSIKDRTVNGVVKDGGVLLNVDSTDLWKTTVGHEITHIAEQSEFIDALKEKVFEYAKNKGVFDDKYNEISELYKGVENADIESEVLADLFGEICGQEGFIESLAVNRNLFQRIYDEIKYFCKIATGKDIDEMEQIKRTFDKVWKTVEKNADNGGVKYSLEKIDNTYYVKAESDVFLNEDGTLKTEREMFNSLVGKIITLPDGEVEIVKRLPGKKMYEELYRRQPRYYKNIENIKKLNSDVNYNMEELLSNSEMKQASVPDVDDRHAKQGITDFDTRTVKFYDGKKAYTVDFSIANLLNGKKIAYAKKFFGLDTELTKKIQTAESRRLINTPFNQQSVSDTTVSQNEQSVNTNIPNSQKNDTKNLAPVREDEKFRLSNNDERTKNNVEKESEIKYNKRRNYNETETLFMSWANGSAPVGEVKRYFRFGKHHFYEKTENGVVELSAEQYDEIRGAKENETYTKAKRRFNAISNDNGSRKAGNNGNIISAGNTRGNSPVPNETVGEELRGDTGRSVSTVRRSSNGTDVSSENGKEKFSLSPTGKQATPTATNIPMRDMAYNGNNSENVKKTYSDLPYGAPVREDIKKSSDLPYGAPVRELTEAG